MGRLHLVHQFPRRNGVEKVPFPGSDGVDGGEHGVGRPHLSGKAHVFLQNPRAYKGAHRVVGNENVFLMKAIDLLYVAAHPHKRVVAVLSPFHHRNGGFGQVLFQQHLRIIHPFGRHRHQHLVDAAGMQEPLHRMNQNGAAADGEKLLGALGVPHPLSPAPRQDSRVYQTDPAFCCVFE